ncbi:RNA polymerase sigma factor [Cohnella silvisoli]|uniref:RNA polymerase sigma factor n=1 Tax=Cohnella silvisoli TaxID=2873699 RepID=A0ABV1KL68_9BACL|nr:RNA polymerase sigma factor [Cohnella silvisoli]MCD9020780.1 RNA polymerase sigma factor [Cohnella silvisoli]
MISTDKMDNTAIEADVHHMEQLQTALKRYCLSLTESSWDAEELAQDAWLKAVTTLKIARHANPEAYLLRIAKNTWIDQTRRKSVFTRLLKSEQPRVTLPNNGSFEIEFAFQALMKHLSPLQRAVFLLRDVFDYSISEAAEMLKTTEGAVKAALHRARHSLEAVKEDLEKDTLPLPEDEGLKTFLRILAKAYQMGDMATLVELVQRNELEPAMAIGILHNRRLHNLRSARRIDSSQTPRSQIQMAA